MRRLVSQTIDPDSESKWIRKKESKWISARSSGTVDGNDKLVKQIWKNQRKNKGLNQSIDNSSMLRYERSKANLLLN